MGVCPWAYSIDITTAVLGGNKVVPKAGNYFWMPFRMDR